MSQGIEPVGEAGGPAQRGHQRRPPLAEVDSWELWQAWRRGERGKVLPWIMLLVSFCLVLAAMYTFFFFSTSLSNDPIAGVVMTLVFAGLLLYLGRRISDRPRFSAMVVGFMTAVSGGAFLLWFLVSALSGWNAWAAIGGTMALGLAGAFIAVPSLNRIERQNGA